MPPELFELIISTYFDEYGPPNASETEKTISALLGTSGAVNEITRSLLLKMKPEPERIRKVRSRALRELANAGFPLHIGDRLSDTKKSLERWSPVDGAIKLDVRRLSKNFNNKIFFLEHPNSWYEFLRPINQWLTGSILGQASTVSIKELLTLNIPGERFYPIDVLQAYSFSLGAINTYLKQPSHLTLTQGTDLREDLYPGWRFPGWQGPNLFDPNDLQMFHLTTLVLLGLPQLRTLCLHVPLTPGQRLAYASDSRAGNLRELVAHGVRPNAALEFFHRQPKLKKLTLQFAERYWRNPPWEYKRSPSEAANIVTDLLSALRLENLEMVTFVAPHTHPFQNVTSVRRNNRWEDALSKTLLLGTALARLPKLQRIALVMLCPPANGAEANRNDLFRFIVKDFEVPPIANRSLTKITLAIDSSHKRGELLSAKEGFLVSGFEWTLFPKEYEVPWSFPYESDGVDMNLKRRFVPKPID